MRTSRGRRDDVFLFEEEEDTFFSFFVFVFFFFFFFIGGNLVASSESHLAKLNWSFVICSPSIARAIIGQPEGQEMETCLAKASKLFQFANYCCCYYYFRSNEIDVDLNDVPNVLQSSRTFFFFLSFTRIICQAWLPRCVLRSLEFSHVSIILRPTRKFQLGVR